MAPKEILMSTHLTPGQKALLESALRLRQQDLDRRLAAQQGGLSRAEHARDVLLQDGDDAPQRDADREVDLALTDLEIVELGRVSRAIEHLRDPDFGLCQDCSAQIPFDRLKLEPHALRCVRCETQRESTDRGAAPRAAV
jgi:DnaK suppressor protein